ncbi:hypothetical protein [Rubritalea marina]|uniref:hypothetical protein n=1 Tax=Rubritalea marina TaxID=361055 RepID=UPI0012EAA71E|nr:hypothetical protein [Rubritalea marina]
MTDAQRERLQKQLKSILEQTTEADSLKKKSAYSAYQRAMSSGAASLELYLKCVEKVDFLDAGKSSSEFREWRRANAELLGDSDFRLALRYQLRWLVLSIEANKRGEQRIHTMGEEARELVSSMLSKADDLMEHRKLLSQNVLQSYFARAYGFTEIKVKRWPTAPANVQAIYKSVILPDLVERKKVSQVRAAWTEMIKFEELRMDAWNKSKSSKIGMKKNMGSAALKKWRAEVYPDLVWNMEQDVLKAGGEYQAISNMITHIGNNLKHKNALKWASELDGLLNVEDEPKAVDAAPPAPKPKVVKAPVKEVEVAPSPAPATKAEAKPKETVIKKSGYIELPL